MENRTSLYEISKKLAEILEDETLFGFCQVEKELAERIGCAAAVVTLIPYPDLNYGYDPYDYFEMMGRLRKIHAAKINELKLFFDDTGIRYATPPASPKNDGNYLAEFSYKWAAIHAGLGFIGRNDVFVHYKYAQRVRISCLLVDLPVPVNNGEIYSRCGNCRKCVDACPHGFVSGKEWNLKIHRNELIDYKKCAAMSRHDGEGPHYLCANCLLACTYPNFQD